MAIIERRCPAAGAQSFRRVREGDAGVADGAEDRLELRLSDNLDQRMPAEDVGRLAVRRGVEPVHVPDGEIRIEHGHRQAGTFDHLGPA